MGRLDGKVALISGGAKGQGAAEARLLSQEGAKVVFGDILDEEGQKVEAEIAEAGGDALYVTWTSPPSPTGRPLSRRPSTSTASWTCW